ncbi:MAG: complex I NDUFA9 subunit family protein [Gammaproteobacteria bacterium]|nr:complex I NDUFA9 subunit family protein [Gammaproteobacteria bacterium]
MSEALVTVFGGSGFLGTRIVARLRDGPYRVRVAVRHPERVATPPVEAVKADVRDEDSVAEAIAGAHAVVNAVGLYVERGAETFDAVHVRGAGAVARQAARAGAARLVHVSGIGADASSRSTYIRARGRGEIAVREGFPAAAILRPSAMFGPGDALLNVLDDITRFAPVIPLFGGGNTRLAPVLVDDVAEAVARALDQPAAPGTTYELGGPDVWAYRDLVERVLEFRGRRRMLMPVPFAMWALGSRVASVLPNPPITPDQVALMRRDNVPDPDAAGFAALGIEPRSVDEMLAATLGD